MKRQLWRPDPAIAARIVDYVRRCCLASKREVARQFRDELSLASVAKYLTYLTQKGGPLTKHRRDEYAAVEGLPAYHADIAEGAAIRAARRVLALIPSLRDDGQIPADDIDHLERIMLKAIHRLTPLRILLCRMSF